MGGHLAIIARLAVVGAYLRDCEYSRLHPAPRGKYNLPMTGLTEFSQRLWRKQLAVPAEHGSWVWLLGPLIIGLAAGGQPGFPSLVLVVAGLTAFMLRQPLTMVVKALSGRRPRHELAPALVWVGFYALVLLAALSGLVLLGFPELLFLAIPGIPVFIWHLVLIARRDERGQMGVDLVGSGVLALAAPAAFWVSGGGELQTALILWVVTWLQAAGSIVHVFLSLRWRKREQTPGRFDRWREGGRSLLYNSFNLIVVIILAAAGLAPGLLTAAFLLMLADNLITIRYPPLGVNPVRIGLRQLAVSSIAVIVIAVGYLM